MLVNIDGALQDWPFPEVALLPNHFKIGNLNWIIVLLLEKMPLLVVHRKQTFRDSHSLFIYIF